MILNDTLGCCLTEVFQAQVRNGYVNSPDHAWIYVYLIILLRTNTYIMAIEHNISCTYVCFLVMSLTYS